MKIDIVVPARRPTVDRLIYSLARQTYLPDAVLVVSNEVTPQPTPGFPVTVVRFSSDHYAVGDHDVVLRRNIGVWESDADILIFQDDDQLAPANMVESAVERVAHFPFAWGHHRYLDFEGRSWDEILALPPTAGRSRETSPNRFHGWYSCYAGMMASRREFLIEIGGFDMQFLGGHAGEDQQLGRRMLAATGMPGAFIHEPPFAWHPEIVRGAPRGWLDAPHSNLCPDGSHNWDMVWYNGVQFRRCTRCPFQTYWSGRTEDNRVIIPYDHSRVLIEKEII